MNKPQTIQLFLPDGNPRSVKIAEITNRLVQAVLIPRSKLGFMASRSEANNVGLYFLFGDSSETLRPQTYLGEAEECFVRLNEHHKDPKKDFWKHAVVFISKTFTKTHVKYLEQLAIRSAIESNRFETMNKVQPKQPFVTESMEADLLDNFETIRVLLSTLGYPVFDAVNKDTVKSKDLLFINFKSIKAEGDFIDDGFIVFKGSEARIDSAASFRVTQLELKQRLLSEGILIEKDVKLIFQEDYIFSSPSAASDMIKGNSSNGWIEWKNKAGKTLDELKRK
jgi:hypothetical protein